MSVTSACSFIFVFQHCSFLLTCLHLTFFLFVLSLRWTLCLYCLHKPWFEFLFESDQNWSYYRWHLLVLIQTGHGTAGLNEQYHTCECFLSFASFYLKALKEFNLGADTVCSLFSSNLMIVLRGIPADHKVFGWRQTWCRVLRFLHHLLFALFKSLPTNKPVFYETSDPARQQHAWLWGWSFLTESKLQVTSAGRWTSLRSCSEAVFVHGETRHEAAGRHEKLVSVSGK